MNTKAFSVMIPKKDGYGHHGKLFSWNMFNFIPLLPVQIISKYHIYPNLKHTISLQQLHKSIPVVQNNSLLPLLDTLTMNVPKDNDSTAEGNNLAPLLQRPSRISVPPDMAFLCYLHLQIPFPSQPPIHRLLIYHVGKMQ